MLYNKDTKTLIKSIGYSSACLECKHYDKERKKCNGLGKSCFEYDPLTKVAIDSITRLPIKFKE